jgi:hypothetical protein
VEANVASFVSAGAKRNGREARHSIGPAPFRFTADPSPLIIAAVSLN